MSLNEVCRFCMGTDEVTYDIFDKNDDTLSKCLMYLHLKIDRKNEISTQICSDCHSILNGFDQFYEKAHEVNEMLKKKTLVNVFKRKVSSIQMVSKQRKIVVKQSEAVAQVNKVAPMDNNEDEIETNKLTEAYIEYNEGDTIMYPSDTEDVVVNKISPNLSAKSSDIEKQKRTYVKTPKSDGTRPFACTICDSSFPIHSALSRHMNIHTRKRVYKCPMCEHESTEMHNLKQHLYTHNSGKTYTCEICQKRFKNPMSIRSHVKSNHPGQFKRHECKRCGKKIYTKQLMEEHMLELHGTTRPLTPTKTEEPEESPVEPQKYASRLRDNTKFKCRLCDEKNQPQPRITHEYAFKLHLKKIHNIQINHDDEYGLYVLNETL